MFDYFSVSFDTRSAINLRGDTEISLTAKLFG